MPAEPIKKIYPFEGDQSVVTCQVIGGQNARYKLQHDFLLVTGCPELEEEDVKVVFLDVADILQKNIAPKTLKDNGTTASVAYVGVDKTIVTANLGDSRISLISLQPDGTIQIIALTEDHNTKNKSEVERLTDMNGFIMKNRICVQDETTKNKVVGLSTTRSFGDSLFNDLVTDTPQMKTFKIEHLPEGSKLFIVAETDGVHASRNADHPTRVKSLEAIAKGSSLEAADVADILVNLALAIDGTDNMSIAVADITEQWQENLVIGAFDGHGDKGHTVSQAAGRAMSYCVQSPRVPEN